MDVKPDLFEESAIAAVADAARAGEALAVGGNGTKAAMLRPVAAARALSSAAHSGIVLHSPRELILSARAGTPVREIEAALAAAGQQLIAEPPDLSRLLAGNDRPQTIGGVVAANLSGPRRIAWGATRDHVMGIRAVTGRAEVVRSGGRVLKNVTGLDLCKLFSGSHGTLGLITEATLKVLPAPEATGTVAVRGLDAKAGVAALSAALGSPFGVSGAAWLPEGAHAAGIDGPVALMRIEDFAPSVAYRTEKLAELLGLPRTEILDDASSRAVWAAVRDADPLAPEPGDAVWRVSTRPSAGPAVLAASAMRGFLDWGGGLVWLTGPATAEAHTRVERAAGAGQWTLMRAPDALRAAVRAVPDDPAPLARIGRRVKDAFDPKGILNPGRVRAGQ